MSTGAKMRTTVWGWVIASTLVATCSAQVLPVRPLTVMQGSYMSSEEAEWNHLRRSTDVQSLQSFQSRYPDGKYRKQVARRIAELQWQDVDKAKPEAVQAFVLSHCSDPYLAPSKKASRGVDPLPAIGGGCPAAQPGEAQLVESGDAATRGMVVRVIPGASADAR